MMKKFIILLLGLGSAFVTSAQIMTPVHFTYSVTKTGSTTFALHITAAMDEGWHIYAQVQPPEAIAIPTAITFNKNPLISLVGIPKEVGDKEKYEDKTTGIIQYQYGHKLDLVQTIRMKAVVKTNISGTITYQACTSEMCLPPKTIPFMIALP